MVMRHIGVTLSLSLILAVGAGTARAAGLQAGEYACSGASGILIGLGFKLRPDGTYTDLDGKSAGRVVVEGSSLRFVGGHLDGQTGRNLQGNSFQIASAACSRS